MTTHPPPPSLRAIAFVFLGIAMQSFGGGLSGWIRREIVQRRGWMTDPQFLSGLALCQIAPGPNAVNLSVFIGTSLRGGAGALAALLGMIGAPMALVIAMGAAIATFGRYPLVSSVMAGVGAAAIGLNLATGLRMARRGVRSVPAAAIVLAAIIAIGGLNANFLASVAVLLPLSLLMAARSRR
ncbi:MAG: chromate transporter [Acidisphaera sp.]|nr:chromate transporter [Acidisphaera sp.]MBV9813636.1 chromate transporter [Acetobacteraceae bacterium]